MREGQIIVNIPNKNNEEKDSSKESWQYYKKIYTEEHWPLIKKFDLENVLTYAERTRTPSKGYQRYLAYVKKEYTSEFGPMFALGGECDFNFNFDKRKQFEKIIEKERYNEELVKQLEDCCSMHHNKINFSLMPTTGSMNNFKGKVYFEGDKIKYEESNIWNPLAYDRLDTFVYCLNEFFINNSSLVLAASTIFNKDNLKNYLRSEFKDIYDYCKKVYFINDKEFIDVIINNGSKPIQSAKDLGEYMDLAVRFWGNKEI